MIEAPLPPDATLTDAITAIEKTHRRIAVVTNNDGRVVGTLTDGDIRRCILNGGNMQTTVDAAMNHNPITVEEHSSDSYVLELMGQANIEALPMIDVTGNFKRIVHVTDIGSDVEEFGDASNFAYAVIMAGGEGMRLRPITENIPKPMVEIGGAPLIEHQIRRLATAGIKKVYISVNYLSHIIEDYFGDGKQYGIEIVYLRENVKLGTAGPLSLIKDKPSSSILVMNGDILSTFDLASLYEYHIAHDSIITVAAIDYLINIPFGVIHSSGVSVTGLSEKPSQRFLCNAGIYVMSPSAFELIPGVCHWNMTDLIETCLANEKEVTVFPVHEYWSDVGTHDDLEKVQEYLKNNKIT